MTINAVLFDMDGTVVDSGRKKQYDVNNTLIKMGVKNPTPQDLREDRWETLCSRYGFTIDEFNDAYRTVLLPTKEAAKMGLISSYEDVRPTLDILAKNYSLAIASSSRPDIADEKLSFCGINNYFKVISAMSDNHNIKPRPDVIIDAFNKLGLEKNKHKIAYVGDSNLDISTMDNFKNAGFNGKTIIVNRENVDCNGSDFVIYNLINSVPIIRGLDNE